MRSATSSSDCIIRTVELTCPACGAPELRRDSQGHYDCPYCGTHFATESTQCPACGVRNEQGADSCYNCSEPLSIVASVLDRQGGPGSLLWIRRLQSQVSQLKEFEAQASADRMSEFEAIDRRRKMAEAEAQARQQEKDRSIVFYGFVVILVIVLAVMIFLALR